MRNGVAIPLRVLLRYNFRKPAPWRGRPGLKISVRSLCSLCLCGGS